MDKTVTVFGGSGFIGSHVCDVLTNRGYKVFIFDKNESPYLKDNQEMIIGDILNKEFVNKTIKESNIVYNFAGIADIDIAHLNPIKSIELNVLGNSYIIDSCFRNKIERFIFASSLYVYNDIGSFYGTTKRASEMIIENYNKLGLSYTILRYGSLYGPRSDKNNFIYKILKQAINEKKITRKGDGEELREYIHVYDAAKWSVDILSDEFKDKSILLTGQQKLKIKDLLLMIKEIFDNKIEVEFSPSEESHHYRITPYLFKPDIGETYNNHKTIIDLGQGILDYIYGGL